MILKAPFLSSRDYKLILKGMGFVDCLHSDDQASDDHYDEGCC